MHCVTCQSTVRPAKATCILVHGFPDTSHGWRHVMRPLALAGFDVYAPDMRGYGDTKFMNKAQLIHEDFSLQAACEDLIALMDALLLPQAVLVGHDWGGTHVWNTTLHFPWRVLAVASFCTPYFPPNPKENPWTKMLAKPGARTRQRPWIYCALHDSSSNGSCHRGHNVPCGPAGGGRNPGGQLPRHCSFVHLELSGFENIHSPIFHELVQRRHLFLPKCGAKLGLEQQASRAKDYAT